MGNTISASSSNSSRRETGFGNRSPDSI
jgi:hypothetical protein